MDRSQLYSGTDRSDDIRVFIARSTPEFDAMAQDGELRLGFRYVFVRISTFTTQRAALVGGLTLGVNELNGLLNGLLNGFIWIMEPSARAF